MSAFLKCPIYSIEVLSGLKFTTSDLEMLVTHISLVLIVVLYWYVFQNVEMLSKDDLSRVVEEFRKKERSSDNLLAALDHMLAGDPICDTDGSGDNTSNNTENSATQDADKSALSSDVGAEGAVATGEVLQSKLDKVTAELESVQSELDVTKQAQSSMSNGAAKSTDDTEAAILATKNADLQREVTDLSHKLEASEKQVSSSLELRSGLYLLHRLVLLFQLCLVQVLMAVL